MPVSVSRNRFSRERIQNSNRSSHVRVSRRHSARPGVDPSVTFSLLLLPSEETTSRWRRGLAEYREFRWVAGDVPSSAMPRGDPANPPSRFGFPRRCRITLHLMQESCRPKLCIPFQSRSPSHVTFRSPRKASCNPKLPTRCRMASHSKEIAHGQKAKTSTRAPARTENEHPPRGSARVPSPSISPRRQNRPETPGRFSISAPKVRYRAHLGIFDAGNYRSMRRARKMRDLRVR